MGRRAEQKRGEETRGEERCCQGQSTLPNHFPTATFSQPHFSTTHATPELTNRSILWGLQHPTIQSLIKSPISEHIRSFKAKPQFASCFLKVYCEMLKGKCFKNGFHVVLALSGKICTLILMLNS